MDSFLLYRREFMIIAHYSGLLKICIREKATVRIEK